MSLGHAIQNIFLNLYQVLKTHVVTMIIIIYLIKSFYSDQPLTNLVGSQCWCIVPVSPGHGGDTCSGVNKNICPSNIVVFFFLFKLYLYMKKVSLFIKWLDHLACIFARTAISFPENLQNSFRVWFIYRIWNIFLLVIEVISLKFTQMY